MKVLINDKLTELTPEILAEIFASMCSEEQSLFYNHLGKCATDWLPMQLQSITDEQGLTLTGRRVMQSIGDYSHWGLRADHMIKQSNQ